ncbi:hypothetical protein TSUD_10080 [Trifolium subterraneum]|nr:hypothetical protein TSUD_10080 [Trifolium subterraneum]
MSTHIHWTEEKSTSVAVGKGGVNVDAGKTKPGGTSVNVGKGGVHVDAGKTKPGGTSVNVGKGGVHVNAGKGKPSGGTSVNVGHGGVNLYNKKKVDNGMAELLRTAVAWHHGWSSTCSHNLGTNLLLFLMFRYDHSGALQIAVLLS